jgi:hypothetical protein
MKSLVLAAIVSLGLTVLAFPVIEAAQGQPSAAQGQKPTGKPHDMTGCLAKGDTAATFRLTNVEGGKVKTVDITEMAPDLKLAAHVGHKVTITGTAVSAPPATDGKKPTGEHYMRVDAVKHVSPTCP